ncbi:MAG: ABC transporter substrate-binding protein, partial [Deltaproteobacteria bacterium]|nr:ABC transporter substrate-binding protein [Deltaproteobacteria bacterium]
MKDNRKQGITRRDFIKKVGVTAGAIGVTSALPKLVKPARAAKRDHILIGRPHPKTGPMAAFTEPSPWIDKRALDVINGQGGIYIKEYNKKVPLKVKFMDTQSDPTKAAEVGSRLILKDKVDLMYVSHAPANVNPVARNCERFNLPCLATVVPIEMFMAGGPYKWSFDTCASVRDFVAAFLEMWADVKTNKVVGILAANEVDGVAFAEGAHAALPPAGYALKDAGRFPEGTMDFSSLISYWKKEKVEIIFGNLAPPDFSRAWRQCHRQGFIPKVCTVGRALLFPSGVESVGGDLGLGTSTEVWWHRSYPFKSSLKGETPKDLCDAYEKATGKQWTQPLGHIYLGYEILVDALGRARTLEKEALRKAFADTDMDTIGGHVKFNKDNCGATPVGAIQWVKGEKFPFDAKIVSNGNWDNLVTQTKLAPIPELRSK